MYHKLFHYKCAGKLLQEAKENGKSAKTTLYTDKKYKFMNIKSLYALVTEALKHWDILQCLIKESNILVNESGLNIWHVRILITELLFGKKVIDSENKLGETILKYEEKFKELLSTDAIKKLLKTDNSNDFIKVRYVKVNTIKESVETVIDCFVREGWEYLDTSDSYEGYLNQLRGLEQGAQQFLQDFHITEVFAFPVGTELYFHELYKNGSLTLMDKSSCLAPFLLRPHAGSTVLDMCAAPGLKTVHLAGIMQSGKVYAVERDAGRFGSLQQMVKQTGAEIVVPIQSDVTKLNVEEFADVEYVLLDPSCSGSGIRDRQRNIDLESQTNDQNRLYRLAGFQLTLLRFALTRFPAAKRVVYSTCSLNVEENEEVVQSALKSKYHDFEIVSIKKRLPQWINFGSEDFEFGSKCIYSRPETDLTNGFFVAVFERKKHYNKEESNSLVKKDNESKLDLKSKEETPNFKTKYNKEITHSEIMNPNPENIYENSYSNKSFKTEGLDTYYDDENNRTLSKKRNYNNNENEHNKQMAHDQVINLYPENVPENNYTTKSFKTNGYETNHGNNINLSKKRKYDYDENYVNYEKPFSSHDTSVGKSNNPTNVAEVKVKFEGSVPSNGACDKNNGKKPKLSVSQKKRIRQRKNKIANKPNALSKNKKIKGETNKTNKQIEFDKSDSSFSKRKTEKQTLKDKISKAKLRYMRKKMLKQSTDIKDVSDNSADAISNNKKKKKTTKHLNLNTPESCNGIDGTGNDIILNNENNESSKIKERKKRKSLNTDDREQCVTNGDLETIETLKKKHKKKHKIDKLRLEHCESENNISTDMLQEINNDNMKPNQQKHKNDLKTTINEPEEHILTEINENETLLKKVKKKRKKSLDETLEESITIDDGNDVSTNLKINDTFDLNNSEINAKHSKKHRKKEKIAELAEIECFSNSKEEIEVKSISENVNVENKPKKKKRKTKDDNYDLDELKSNSSNKIQSEYQSSEINDTLLPKIKLKKSKSLDKCLDENHSLNNLDDINICFVNESDLKHSENIETRPKKHKTKHKTDKLVEVDFLSETNIMEVDYGNTEKKPKRNKNKE